MRFNLYISKLLRVSWIWIFAEHGIYTKTAIAYFKRINQLWVAMPVPATPALWLDDNHLKHLTRCNLVAFHLSSRHILRDARQV